MAESGNITVKLHLDATEFQKDLQAVIIRRIGQYANVTFLDGTTLKVIGERAVWTKPPAPADEIPEP